jgi:hypothetical protein
MQCTTLQFSHMQCTALQLLGLSHQLGANQLFHVGISIIPMIRHSNCLYRIKEQLVKQMCSLCDREHIIRQYSALPFCVTRQAYTWDQQDPINQKICPHRCVKHCTDTLRCQRDVVILTTTSCDITLTSFGCSGWCRWHHMSDFGVIRTFRVMFMTPRVRFRVRGDKPNLVFRSHVSARPISWSSGPHPSGFASCKDRAHAETA